VTAILATMLITSGIATRYDPGVMDEVVYNRVQWGQVDPETPHLGYVALLDADWIGRQVWIEHPDGRVFGPVVVADCAATGDRARLVQLGFAVDVSWELAQVLGVVDGPVAGFKVWDGEPRNAGWLRTWSGGNGRAEDR
jgi:hypothetical protein